MGLTSDANASDTVARSNLDKIVDAMVDIYNHGGGHIYFRPGTYCIDRPVRVLPGVSFEGLNGNGTHPDPSQVVLKNKNTGQSQWFHHNTVLFGGFDGADEGSDTAGTVTFRRISLNGGVWPAAGDTRIRVWPYDYDKVNVGDEIKILSASNSTEVSGNGTLMVRPDCMVKAMISSKSTSGGYWLYLDRPLPYSFGTISSSQVQYQWGLNNVDKTNDPAITKGQPCWNKVNEWYKTDYPDYWTHSGQHGYDTYLAMSPTDGKWVKGWSTRNCTFSYMTFQSAGGIVTGGAGQCDSTFDHCIFQGKKCFYYNGCQYTNFTNTTCTFWDEVAEFSYNSLNCTLNNITATYNGGLKPSWDTLSSSGGMFTLNESSCGFSLTNSTIDASSRSLASNTNSMIRVAGRDNTFNTLTLSCPQLNTTLYILPQDPDAISPTNVQFHNLTVNMNGNTVGNPVLLASGNFDGSNYITIDTTTFTNTPTPPACNLVVTNTQINHITLGPTLVMPGRLAISSDMTGRSFIAHYTGSSFAGFVHPNIEVGGKGMMGNYPGTITWQP